MDEIASPEQNATCVGALLSALLLSTREEAILF